MCAATVQKRAVARCIKVGAESRAAGRFGDNLPLDRKLSRLPVGAAGSTSYSLKVLRMRVLLLNQCFYPDHVATAQHLTDLALALVERGHRVTVLTSRRGYDDPTQCFKARETWHGIDVMRIPTLALGKAAKWRRVLNFASFLLFCFARLTFLPRQHLTVALTSPPLISCFGALFAQVRGGRFCSWVMDLNPDESVALGWLREDSLVTRALQALLKYSLQRSDKIIALDRFMQERIVRKGVPADRVAIVPPWAHDDAIGYDEAGRADFRLKHGLNDKFVVNVFR